MKIIHITNPAGYGGLESVVAMLASGTAERAHDVSVLAVVGNMASAQPFIEQLQSARIPHETILAGARSYLRERTLVAELLSREKPDIVHTHGYRTDVVDSPVVRRSGAAVVSTVHGFTAEGWKGTLYEWLQIRSYRRFDAVVAVSKPIVDRLVAASVPGQRIHLVRNSFRPQITRASREEARRELGLDPAHFHVGWVGRLSAEKGPDVMLEATRLLGGGEIFVSFLGDGTLRGELQSATASADLGGRVRFHGNVPNAGSLLAAFDVVVISSRTEGTPIVLLESIVAAVPVVSTRVGGIPDVVSATEAILVDSEDAAGLAAAVQRVRGDKQLAENLTLAAQRRIERELSFTNWIDSYERVYQSALRMKKLQ